MPILWKHSHCILNVHRKAGLQATDKWRRSSKHRGTSVHCNLSTSQYCKFTLHLETSGILASRNDPKGVPIHAAFTLHSVCDVSMRPGIHRRKGHSRRCWRWCPRQPPPKFHQGNWAIGQCSFSAGLLLGHGYLLRVSQHSVYTCITLVVSIQYDIILCMKALPTTEVACMDMDLAPACCKALKHK